MKLELKKYKIDAFPRTLEQAQIDQRDYDLEQIKPVVDELEAKVKALEAKLDKALLLLTEEQKHSNKALEAKNAKLGKIIREKDDALELKNNELRHIKVKLGTLEEKLLTKETLEYWARLIEALEPFVGQESKDIHMRTLADLKAKLRAIVEGEE